LLTKIGPQLLAKLSIKLKRKSQNQNTFDEKRGTAFHELETHPKNARDSKIPLTKKEAPHFTNQKRIPKNTRGSK
jgi:hypothetical protein